MLAVTILLGGCGDPPASPPEQLRGHLEVVGIMPNDSLADSVQITIDEVLLGTFENPHLCENIVAGTHLVEVNTQEMSDSTLIEYSGAQQVTILPDSTIQRQFALLGLAPDFKLYDLDSNLVSMSSLSGKVVMLYFFVST